MRAFAGKEAVGLDDDALDVHRLRGAPGLSVVLPAVPFDGEWVAAVARAAEEVGAAHGLDPEITVSGIGQTALEGPACWADPRETCRRAGAPGPGCATLPL